MWRIATTSKKQIRKERNKKYKIPKIALSCERIFTQAISLGSFCHAAYALKYLGIRQFAGPFDWIISDSKMQIHCLKDKFSDFLNPRYYRNTRDKESLATHALFGYRTFVHRDPRCKKDFLYYERCTKRFLNLLNSKEYKFFIQVWSKNKFPLLKEEDMDYLQVYNQLRLQTCNFLFMIIILKQAANRLLKIKIDTPSLVVFELYHCSPSLGLQFANEDDNQLLYSAFRNFSFAVKKSTKTRVFDL